MPSPEEEVGASVLGKTRLGGVHSAKVADVKAGLKVDGQGVAKLDKEVNVLTKSIGAMAAAWDRVTKSAGRAAGASANAANAGAPGGRSTATNGMPLPPPAPGSPTITPLSSHIPPGGGAGINTGGNFGGLRAWASQAATPIGGVRNLGVAMAGQAAGQMVGALDQRVDRGIDYAMSADRISVMMQQQFGKSQQQVMNEMRQPLAKMRLGAGGINSMLEFQSQTGVQATAGMAQSIAGIRALNGYSKTTADVLTDQRSMMDPTVANRMFSMLGTNAYNFGGGTKDPMQLRQQLVQSMGLANEGILKGALTPGSVTRGRMADAGIGSEMQDELIKYAQSQVNFQKKGGQGMYNPGNADHRKTMGIEKNFATQVEETDAKRTQREEQFMERQIDNYASLEQNTQKMVGILGSIEDKLSGIIGARTSSRGYQKIAGRIAQGVGLAMLATPAAPAGAAIFAGGSIMSGDPAGGGPGATGTPSGGSGNSSSANDANIAIPVGYGGGKATLNEVKQRSDFKRMNPRMQDKLLRMFRENPNVGIGGGYRDSSAQESMFRSRYRPTSGKGDVEWQGQNWEHVSGAAAAPPGRSMHEIGLAADLVGDIGWMNANAARFGLKHFAGVNNEPWHVQPSELPNSRREYEGGGAVWGSDDYFAPDDPSAPTKPTTGVEADNSEHSGAYGGGTGRGVGGYGGLTISQIVASVQGGTSSFQGSAGTPRGRRSQSSPGGGVSTGTNGGSVAISGTGAELAARAAYNAGFRGNDLFKIVAIAGRESGFNPNSINRSSRDTGMWQIAPVNWGSYSQSALLDPANNAAAAWKLFQSSGFNGWKASDSRMKNSAGHWVVDPSGKGGAGWAMDGNELWNTESHQAAARVAVESITGDPSGPHASAPQRAPQRGASSAMQTPLVMSPNYNITVAPVIKMEGHGAGGAPTFSDLKKIASDVGMLLREEMKTVTMRSE